MSDITPIPTEHQSRFLQEVFDVTMHKTASGIEAQVVFHDRHQGPPNHAHGGSIATVLDELMGFAAFNLGHKVLAARLGVKYKAPVPLHTELTAICEVKERYRRKINIISTLKLSDGTILATSEGVFVDIGDRFYEMGANQEKD